MAQSSEPPLSNRHLQINSIPLQQSLHAQVEEKIQPVGWFELFRFATQADYVLMIVGSVMAVGIGAALPVAMMLWGQIIANLEKQETRVSGTRRLMEQMVYLGLGALVAGWSMVTCWKVTGQRQGVACRKKYLQSLLAQDVAWFDSNNQLEITAKFNRQLLAYQQALNDMIPVLISSLSMLVTALVIAFIHGWLMTLVLLAVLAFIFFSAFLYGSGHINYAVFKTKIITKAGALVQQSIRAIKTVKHLNGEDFEAERYSELIQPIAESISGPTVMIGVGVGLLYGGLLFKYAAGFWFGSHCLEGDQICPASLNGGQPYTIEDVFITFLTLHFSIFVFIQFSPALKKLIEGKVSAALIFHTIDRQPLIRSPVSPKTILDLKGVFAFENVTFGYPKSKDKPVLRNLTLKIDYKTAALVGDSGCGKSTIFQLMMRFYDPDQGRVTLDGVDLRELDLAWLRSQIGYVGQQPILFGMSLRDNLLCSNLSATEQDMISSMIDSESYEFVNSLKDGLETYAGTGGRQISGGQKQRLAIARVLLKKPKIMLLDEATSALDRKNENLIQMTLNDISQGRVSISIAHRVNTIRACEQIFVIQKGSVSEQGTFESLRRYHHLRTKQNQELMRQEQKRLAELYSKRSMERSAAYQLKVSDVSAAQNISVSSKNRSQKEVQKLSQIEQSEQELVERYSGQPFISRMLKYCHKRMAYALGISMAFLHGLAYPFFSIFVARFNVTFYRLDLLRQPSDREELDFIFVVFVLFGIGQVIFSTVGTIAYYYAGDNIAVTFRKQTYHKILKMPLSWLEKPSHSSSAMVDLLNIDCENVNNFIHTYVGLSVEIAAVVVGGVIVSMFFSWRLGLISLALFPLILFAGSARTVFARGSTNSKNANYNSEIHHMSEAVIFIRTVKAISAERMFLRHQQSLLDQPIDTAIKSGLLNGLLFGLSQLLLFFMIGLMFFLGAVFTQQYDLELQDALTSVYIFLIGGILAGNKIQFMPSYRPIKLSVLKVFSVLDSEDEDQLQVRQESKMLTTPVRGNIQFDRITFAYQQRDTLFQDFSMEVKAGQKIGLVGHSGSGKSSLIQLVLRFYEPSEGSIKVDGIDIRDYDLHYLRSCFGVVEQEPVLFDESIAYNVRYNVMEVGENMILQSLERAQLGPQEWKKLAIEDSQQELTSRQENFLQRKVGVQGSHLSGGQKQRIAIARILLRQPAILLFDEATSALDSQNELRVQQVLETVTEGKTSLTVAHRIGTIQASDRIVLFSHGQIIEEGRYDELIRARGQFYEFEKGVSEQQMV